MSKHACILDRADCICLVELVKNSDLNSYSKSDIIKKLRNPIPISVIQNTKDNKCIVPDVCPRLGFEHHYVDVYAGNEGSGRWIAQCSVCLLYDTSDCYGGIFGD